MFQPCFEQEPIKEGGTHAIYRASPRERDGSHRERVQRAPPASSLLSQGHLLIYLRHEAAGMKTTGKFNQE